MFVSFFMEIDVNGNAKYVKEFNDAIGRAKDGEGYVLASKEYYDLLVEKDKEYCIVIPEDVLEKISENLVQKCDRDILLLIKRESALEEWIQRVISEKENITEIKAYGAYVSLIEVAKCLDVEMYSEVSKKSTSINDNIRRMTELFQEQEERYQKENESLQENVKGLKEYITSTENYVKELQIHATKLDDELKIYRSEDKDSIEYLEKEREKYLNLYKENLKKMNEIETAYLDLKEKQSKHR